MLEWLDKLELGTALPRLIQTQLGVPGPAFQAIIQHRLTKLRQKIERRLPS